jgi:hypothetical protein
MEGMPPRDEMTTGVVVLRVLTIIAMVVSALPMLLLAFGMMAIVGQQCTPTSVSHTTADQLEIIAMAFAGYAIPMAPAIVLRMSRQHMLPKAIISLLLALAAVVYAFCALALTAIGTAC